MPNPHDRLFKRVFGEPENAIGELTSVLPEEIHSRISWESLRTEPGSYVADDLRESHSDILFSAQFAGHEALLYLLLEHKSQQDRWTVLQVLSYVVEIWRRRIRDRQSEGLPLVLPIVVHHGRTRWSAPTEIADLVNLPPHLHDSLAPHTVRFRIFVDDLVMLDEQSLRGRAMTSLATLGLFCLQRLRDCKAPWNELRRVADLVRDLAQAPRGNTFLFTLLSYIIEIREEPSREACEHFLQGTLGSDTDSIMTSWIDEIRNEGQAKGRAEGRAEGAAEVLQELLAERFGVLPAATIDRIRAASSEQVAEWARNVVRGESLADLLDERKD